MLAIEASSVLSFASIPEARRTDIGGCHGFLL
jgi:hypothetical protein